MALLCWKIKYLLKKLPKQRSPSSLQVIKTWTCFSASAYAPLASNPSTNQLQIFPICFSSVTGSVPHYPADILKNDVLSRQPHSFSWHSSVLNPFCQNKVIWFTLLWTSRSYSLEQTTAHQQTYFFHQLFQNISKNLTFLSTKYVIFHSRSGDRDVNTTAYICVGDGGGGGGLGSK